jgi:hypothetical protein
MSTLRVAQIRSKIKENGSRAQNFLRLRRAVRGFAFGAVRLTPNSATLTVTIIPVSRAVGVGTPGNGATEPEGNEHAHQDMKQFFLHLTCHSAKGERGGDCLQVLRLLTVKQQTLRPHAAKWLPASSYAAMRANVVINKEADQNPNTKGGAKGLKVYGERDEKMVAVCGSGANGHQSARRTDKPTTASHSRANSWPS